MSIWSQARELAVKTPPERNRYVDFLRAASILVVISGHWLVASIHYVDGKLIPGHMLESEPAMRWLTWLFQVMPIFFFVGGFANGVSLDSAKRKGVGYRGWLASRLHRLVAPMLLLFVAWAVIASSLHFAGIPTEAIQFMSRSALIPTWFLAIYLMIVVLAPPAYAAWRRYGFASFWALAGMAVLMDVLFFTADMHVLGWSNYFWVWLAVHQLGFAWRDNRLGSPLTLFAYAAIAFAVLYAVIAYGPYPLAMVGFPGEAVSNTLPPKATLLILGIVQVGLLLAIENPMRRILKGSTLWTGTVLINSMIMTVYLWHMTVMIGLIAVLYYSGGFGLGLEPGTSAWWLSRVAWLAALFALLVPVALALSPLERTARGQGPVPPGIVQVAGAMMISLGVALLAMHGVRGGDRLAWTISAFVLLFAGAASCGLWPKLRNPAPGDH